jgi:hypothetical protein
MAKRYLKKVKDQPFKNNCADCYFEIYSMPCNKMYDKYGCFGFHFEKKEVNSKTKGKNILEKKNV